MMSDKDDEMSDFLICFCITGATSHYPCSEPLFTTVFYVTIAELKQKHFEHREKPSVLFLVYLQCEIDRTMYRTLALMLIVLAAAIFF